MHGARCMVHHATGASCWYGVTGSSKTLSSTDLNREPGNSSSVNCELERRTSPRAIYGDTLLVKEQRCCRCIG